VLDVACGDGVLSLALAARTDRVASVLASDYSAAMCSRLEQQASGMRAAEAQADSSSGNGSRHPPMAPLRTLVADAQDLSSIPSDSIDLCFCSFGLMLIPDGRRALAEMKRVVKPGGLIAVASWAALQSQLYMFMLHLVDHVHAKHAERRTASAGTGAGTESSTAGASDAGSAAAPAATAAAPSFAEDTHSRLANMPFSRLSEYSDALAALQLQPVLLRAHTEQTGEFADADHFWRSIVGALPSFQPPPAADAAEEEAMRQWASDYIERAWGAQSPFRLTSMSIVALARKPIQEQQQ
jgi:SAM-dependent methyltransferase